MFRLPADRALVNRMGFNNDGAQAAAARLARAARSRLVVGVNIGKTKPSPRTPPPTTSRQRRALAPLADYLVVNVSSPNTPGLRDLQAVEQLRPLLAAARERRSPPPAGRVPLLVKIAPDLADEDIDAVADLALELGLDGIIATNTTIARAGLRTSPSAVADAGAGGLSGAPLAGALARGAAPAARARRRRAGARRRSAASRPPTTLAERIAAGATLVQAYTGFVYGGPLWPRACSAGSRATFAMRVRTDSLRAGIASFWQNVGRNMRDPKWVWGNVFVDRLGDDAAVLTATWSIPHIAPTGHPHVIRGAWTAVFRRIAGEWMIVVEHLSVPAA